MRPGARWTAALVAAATSLIGLGASAQQPDPLPGYEVKLTNLERAVTLLAREYSNASATLEKRSLQRRLIDLRIAFEMGNYQTAAILAFDAVSEYRFDRHRDYFPTTMVLAESLFKLGNVQGAASYFEIVARAPDAKLADRARSYLIDMALNADNLKRLRLLVSQMSSGAVQGNTRYALGKAHIRLKDFDKAITVFQGIGPANAKHFLAQYYLGVALTAKKQYDSALALFTKLGKISAKTPEEETARDLANLAAGRLHMEKADTTNAVVSYQRIGRYSPSYDLALYEMAWAYIKSDKYKRAMRAADILLLVVQDEQLAVEAYVLRGRLSIMLDDYDAAVDSYERILTRFAPIRNELQRFTQDPANIDAYFEWLLKRHRNRVELGGPLSKKTSRWVASADSFGRIVKVFNQLSIEAGEIRETRELANELEKIVSASNRVERFPALKDGWTRALALQDGMLTLSTALLELQHKRLAAGMSPDSRKSIDEMRSYRKQLEAQWRRVPKTIEAYRQRTTAVGAEYSELDRKAFLIETSLKQVKEQLMALEVFLNKKQFADRGQKLTAEREAELRQAVEGEKTQLTKIYDDLVRIKKEISLESKTVGTGDAVSQGEAQLRVNLIAAHRREGQAYTRLGGSAAAARNQRIDDMLRRIAGGIESLGKTIVEIDKKVATKVNTLVRIIAREKAKLDQYSVEMAAHENSGRIIARAVGEKLFEDARKRMQTVVLEADVGLIDVAWEKKQRKTAEIRDIQQERAKRLQKMNESADRLLKEAGAGEDKP